MKKRFPGSFDHDDCRAADADSGGPVLSERELLGHGIASMQSSQFYFQGDSAHTDDKQLGSSTQNAPR